MNGIRVIDPDAFLETGAGRIWTPERNAAAWCQAFAALRGWLEAGTVARLVVVCGLQGSGKSTWIASQEPEAGTVCFDAALPGARHRAPIVALARSYGVPVAAVWIRAPLALALERNSQRPDDRRVPAESIRSVDRLFEPPGTDEGFVTVRVVEA